NLHGYLARERIFYGSEEGLDFTNMYFYSVTYHAIKASMEIAKERGERFYDFENSKYATGEYFDKYIDQVWEPRTKKMRNLFAESHAHLPSQEEWKRLRDEVAEHGMYSAYLQAVPRTGSISHINHSTSSNRPIGS